MRVLELFAGIGGLAAAWPEATIAAAIDISRPAGAVYKLNFPHPYLTREIESLQTDELAALAADCWWLSPPCQPYTVRGARRDLADPRSKGFVRIVTAIEELRPQSIGLENVPGFAQSQALAELLKVLEQHGYQFATRELWPNVRFTLDGCSSH